MMRHVLGGKVSEWQEKGHSGSLSDLRVLLKREDTGPGSYVLLGLDGERRLQSPGAYAIQLL